MDKENLQLARQYFDSYVGYLSPADQQITDELDHKLGNYLSDDALATHRSAIANANLIMDVAELLPRADRLEQFEADRLDQFELTQSSELRQLQTYALWLAASYFTDSPGEAQPYYIFGMANQGFRTELLLANGAEGMRHVGRLSVRSQLIDKQQAESSAKLVKQLDNQQVDKYYDVSLDKLIVDNQRSKKDMLRLYHGSPIEYSATPAAVGALIGMTVFTCGVAPVYCLTRAIIHTRRVGFTKYIDRDVLKTGITDADLVRLNVIRQISKLASAFDVSSQVRSILASYEEKAPSAVNPGSANI